jgi:hypothetical protein
MLMSMLEFNGTVGSPLSGLGFHFAGGAKCTTAEAGYAQVQDRKWDIVRRAPGNVISTWRLRLCTATRLAPA